MNLARRSKLRYAIGAATIVASVTMAACGGGDGPTPTPIRLPTSTPALTSTPTPVPSQVARDRVQALFERQYQHIKEGDWAAVYMTCSPPFRETNDVDRFVRQAEQRFAVAGFTPEGFEVRNLQIRPERDGRVTVHYDAYENGEARRTINAGGIYIRLGEQWYDQRSWCR